MSVIHIFQPDFADLHDYLSRTLPVVGSIHKPQLAPDWSLITTRLYEDDDRLPRLELIVTDRNRVERRRQSYSVSLIGSDTDRDRALRAVFAAATALSHGRDVRLDEMQKYDDPAVKDSLDFPYNGVWMKQHIQ